MNTLDGGAFPPCAGYVGGSDAAPRRRNNQPSGLEIAFTPADQDSGDQVIAATRSGVDRSGHDADTPTGTAALRPPTRHARARRDAEKLTCPSPGRTASLTKTSCGGAACGCRSPTAGSSRDVGLGSAGSAPKNHRGHRGVHGETSCGRTPARRARSCGRCSLSWLLIGTEKCMSCCPAARAGGVRVAKTCFPPTPSLKRALCQRGFAQPSSIASARGVRT